MLSSADECCAKAEQYPARRIWQTGAVKDHTTLFTLSLHSGTLLASLLSENKVMVRRKSMKRVFAIILSGAMLLAATAMAAGQGKSGDKQKNKEEKKLEKEARKLASKAEDAEKQLGRNAVFCILAAHTDIGTAQELKDKFESLENFPFGQFVAAVLLADRAELALDNILSELAQGKSLGQIAKAAGASMGELRRGFGEFRSELARSITNPPTRDCFQSAF
jgi:Sec-independent protein translocase protein TatA